MSVPHSSEAKCLGESRPCEVEAVAGLSASTEGHAETPIFPWVAPSTDYGHDSCKSEELLSAEGMLQIALSGSNDAKGLSAFRSPQASSISCG